MIELENVTVRSHSGVTLLENIRGTISQAGFHVICGPNGSGKTTLMRSMCGLQSLADGKISYDGKPLTGLHKLALAHLLAWVPAEQPLHFGYSVGEVVSWGRWYAHQGTPSKQDRNIIDSAMDAMGISSFKNRIVTELSLGEQKRVHLARAIAADTPYLLLDEPCGPLDAGVTLDIMDWIRRTVRTQKRKVM